MVTLSTSVQSQSTHWKQCVLWLSKDNFMTLVVGTVVCGTVEYRRCKECSRDYDIILTAQYEDRGIDVEISQEYALRS